MPHFDTTACLTQTFRASSSRLRLVSRASITVLPIEAWPIQWFKRGDRATPFEFAKEAHAATRLGLHVTQEELNCWRQRAGINPQGSNGITCPVKYRSAGDVSANSPGDWDRTAANASAFLSSPSADFWDGNDFSVDGSGCAANGSPVRPENERGLGSNMRDAAFYILIKPNDPNVQSIASNIRSQLMAEAARPNLNWSNTRFWCVQPIGDGNPWFNIAAWHRRMLLAYDFLKAADALHITNPTVLSSGDITTLNNWFLPAAHFWQQLIQKGIDWQFSDGGNGSTDNLPTQFTNADNLCNTPTNNTQPYAYDGSPVIYFINDLWNNRKANMNDLIAMVGVMLNDTVLKNRAVQYAKLWIAYGTQADGTSAEFARGTSSYPGLGWAYSAETVASFVTAADVFARNGDTRIYDFSTTATVNGGSGCTVTNATTKTLRSIVTRTDNYMDHTVTRYFNGFAGNSSYVIDSNDELGGQGRVHDAYSAMGNVFWRDTYIRGSYLRTNPGAPPYPVNPAASGPSAWEGENDQWPGILFMFGNMEGQVNPYGTGGGTPTTPTPTPSSSPSQKFKLGDRVQPTTDVTVHSYAAYIDTNVVGSQPAGAQGTIIGGPTLGTDNVWWWQVDYDSGADGWNGEGILTKSTSPTPTPTVGPTACSIYTSTTAIPTGFGSPYDVVSSPNTNLMQVSCTTSSATITLGKAEPLQYIYNTGYLFKTGATNWTQISYTSAESLIANAWYPKTATTNISMTSTELANPSYNLAYICSWTGAQWKCGCRDAACTQSYWQIQSFKR